MAMGYGIGVRLGRVEERQERQERQPPEIGALGALGPGRESTNWGRSGGYATGCGMAGIRSSLGGFKAAKTAKTVNPWRLAVLPSRLGRAVLRIGEAGLRPGEAVPGAVLGRRGTAPARRGCAPAKLLETLRNLLKLADLRTRNWLGTACPCSLVTAVQRVYADFPVPRLACHTRHLSRFHAGM